MAKQVYVQKNGDKLIWLAENNAEGDCEVKVDEGCQALVFYDGRCDDPIYPGRTKINATSGFFRKTTAYQTCRVYGIDTSQEFEIPCGVRVPYKDQQYCIEVKIQANSFCKVRIENGSILYRRLWTGDSSGIDAAGLAERLRAFVTSSTDSCISKVANEERDHTKIIEKKSQIEKDIEASLKPVLRREYGLNIAGVIVTLNNFLGLEDILESEKNVVIEGYGTKIAEEKSAQQKAAAAGLKATLDAVTPKRETGTDKQKKETIDLLKKDKEDK